MKKYLALILPVLLFIGCATPPQPETIASYLADARDIAELGTVAALIENPAYRHELELTRNALMILEHTDGNASVDDLLAALSTLPIGELQSEKGRIYVTGGRILLRRFVAWKDKQVDVAELGYVQQFAKALGDGMDAGLQ